MGCSGPPQEGRSPYAVDGAGQPSRQPGGTGVPAGTRTATADDVSTPPLLEVPDSHTTTRSVDPVRVVPLPPRAELPEPDRGTAQAARPVLNATAPRASATRAGKNADVRTMARPLCPFLPRNDDDRPPFGMGPVSPGSPSAFSDHSRPTDQCLPERVRLSSSPPVRRVPRWSHRWLLLSTPATIVGSVVAGAGDAAPSVRARSWWRGHGGGCTVGARRCRCGLTWWSIRPKPGRGRHRDVAALALRSARSS